MDDRTARLFSGLGLLVLVWIVVYWTWPAGEPAVTTSTLEDLESDPPLPVVEPEPAAPVTRRPEPRVQPTPTAVRAPEPVPLPQPEAAEATAPPAGGVIPPRFEDYVVVAGDNYERISERVYGTRRHAMAIARANPLQDPGELQIGQVIRVPVDPGNVQGQPVYGPPPAPAQAAAEIEYTVKPGDTLSGIAKSFYGSTGRVDFLYEANRDRLRSKHDLRVGQVLRIPPLPDGAD